MSDSETWDELRSVLHHGGEPDLERLVEVLGGWSEPERDERLIAYLTDHLDPSSRGVAAEPPALPLLRCWMRGQLLFLIECLGGSSSDFSVLVDVDRLLEDLADGDRGGITGELITRDTSSKGALVEVLVQSGATIHVDASLRRIRTLGAVEIIKYLDYWEMLGLGDDDGIDMENEIMLDMRGFRVGGGSWPVHDEGGLRIDLNGIQLMPYLSRGDDIELYSWFELAWRVCARADEVRVEWWRDDEELFEGGADGGLQMLWTMYRTLRSSCLTASG